MPLSGGTSGAHDDSMHQGNAKRDTAGGLAGLDAGGNSLALGSNVQLARDVSNYMKIVERTSGEEVCRITRIGAADYTISVKVSGIRCFVQHAGMKDVVSGIAALDAAGALLVPGSKIYYTRDGSNDVHIYERTSNEEAYAFHRVGANDYTFHVKESNVWKRMQTESMKDIANGIAGLDASSKVLSAVLPIPMLTIAQFQANAATGTCTNPARINNNAYTLFSNFTSVGHYGEVEFDYYNFVTKYRVYGHHLNNQDGTYKIQHYEDGAWVDNTLNIPTNLATWSSWAFLDIPVYTKKIRLVATVIDSHDAVSLLGELEIEG